MGGLKKTKGQRFESGPSKRCKTEKPKGGVIECGEKSKTGQPLRGGETADRDLKTNNKRHQTAPKVGLRNGSIWLCSQHAKKKSGAPVRVVAAFNGRKPPPSGEIKKKEQLTATLSPRDHVGRGFAGEGGNTLTAATLTLIKSELEGEKKNQFGSGQHKTQMGITSSRALRRDEDNGGRRNTEKKDKQVRHSLFRKRKMVMKGGDRGHERPLKCQVWKIPNPKKRKVKLNGGDTGVMGGLSAPQNAKKEKKKKKARVRGITSSRGGGQVTDWKSSKKMHTKLLEPGHSVQVFLILLRKGSLQAKVKVRAVGGVGEHPMTRKV